MIDRLLGALVRAIHDRYIGAKTAPPRPASGIEPYAVFEGRITMNQISGTALTGEWDLGPYDPETGRREIKKEGGKVDAKTRLTTFIDDEDGGQQMTLRWEKGGKIKLSKARKDEVWRIEFYKVADAQESVVPTVAGSAPSGFQPFGGSPGGGYE